MNECYVTAIYPERTELAAWSTLIWHSIKVLNEPEHHNDRATIERWHKNALYVLVHGEFLVGAYDSNTAVRKRLGIAGMSVATGELQLLYVLPSLTLRGVGSQLLQAMEKTARMYCHKQMILRSSGIGRAFYQKHGYEFNGKPEQGAGVSWNYPMVKKL